MNEKEIRETIAILDKTHPNGWRCGDVYIDSMTILLTHGIRQIVKGMFNGTYGASEGRNKTSG